MIEPFNEKWLKGSFVTLRRMEKDDREAFIEMESNMENRLFMNDAIPFPPTDDDHDQFLNGISADKEEYLFAIERMNDQAFIGTISIYAINWVNGTCHVRISIGSPHQGKGLGTDAMNALLDFIFHYLRINKVKLSVFSFNQRAIRSYEKCGFQHEGVLRQEIFRFGQYHDLIVMRILREEWKKK